MTQSEQPAKKRRHPREDCTAKEFLDFLEKQGQNPEPVLDHTALQSQTAAWHSDWRKSGLGQLHSSDDIFQRPQRAVRISLEGNLPGRPIIFFDKPTGEFLGFTARSVWLLNKLSLAGIEDVTIDLAALNWARGLSERVLKSSGKIVDAVRK